MVSPRLGKSSHRIASILVVIIVVRFFFFAVTFILFFVIFFIRLLSKQDIAGLPTIARVSIQVL
jgi:hypothetical protein